jgi:hypothetical protein
MKIPLHGVPPMMYPADPVPKQPSTHCFPMRAHTSVQPKSPGFAQLSSSH